MASLVLTSATLLTGTAWTGTAPGPANPTVSGTISSSVDRPDHVRQITFGPKTNMQDFTTFGDGGRQPGQFFAVHSIATDSKGNLYTTETYEGRRLQKFVFKGVTAVPRWQGVVWPTGK